MVEYLLNKSNDLGSRDDCAMDLYEFDLPEVEAALVTVASDASDEEMVIDSAGESLCQIYKRQGRVVSVEVLSAFQPSAKKFFERSDAKQIARADACKIKCQAHAPARAPLSSTVRPQ